MAFSGSQTTRYSHYAGYTQLTGSFVGKTLDTGVGNKKRILIVD